MSNLPAIPNLNQVRGSSDTTIADTLQQTVAYIGKNVTPAEGNKVAPPPLHVVNPTNKV
jgi:hypothetical protein